jgi:hypothetical protein
MMWLYNYLTVEILHFQGTETTPCTSVTIFAKKAKMYFANYHPDTIAPPIKPCVFWEGMIKWQYEKRVKNKRS